MVASIRLFEEAVPNSQKCHGCLFTLTWKSLNGIKNFGPFDPCMTCTRANAALRHPGLKDNYKDNGKSKDGMRHIW